MAGWIGGSVDEDRWICPVLRWRVPEEEQVNKGVMKMVSTFEFFTLYTKQ